MSRDRRHDDNDPTQAQGQLEGQAQGQLEAQAQGQLQLQGQGQGQGQGQSQSQNAFQGVGQAAFALNENKSENENENDNKNSNENEIDNKLDNSVENKVDSSVDNDVDNKVENNVENNVDVKVNVEVDLDIDGKLTQPSEADVIDIDEIEHIFDSVVTADVVTQTLNDGNMFNIDQVNNLADQDVSFASLSYGSASLGLAGLFADDPGTESSFSMWAKAEGGEAKADGIEAKVGDDGSIDSVGLTSADAIVNQEAFTQNIVLGSNIQFNQIDITAAGNNLTMDDSL